MNYTDIKLFSLMKTKMDYLAARQDVLSQDIAHIDTPGYKGKDLKPLDFSKLASDFAGKLEMKTTNYSHQAVMKSSSGSAFKVQEIKNPDETKPISNSVSVEEQMMKMNDTAMEYATVTSLYSKVSGLFKTAIGKV